MTSGGRVTTRAGGRRGGRVDRCRDSLCLSLRLAGRRSGSDVRAGDRELPLRECNAVGGEAAVDDPVHLHGLPLQHLLPGCQRREARVDRRWPAATGWAAIAAQARKKTTTPTTTVHRRAIWLVIEVAPVARSGKQRAAAVFVFAALPAVPVHDVDDRLGADVGDPWRRGACQWRRGPMRQELSRVGCAVT